MVRMGDAQTVPGRPAPEMGQHTREVLDEFRLQSERNRLALRRGSGALTSTGPTGRDTDGVADTNPLSGVVVLDLSTGIPGAFFGGLLADGGAEIILVECPEGNTLRRWSTSGEPPADSALFQFLSGAKRSVVADPETPADVDLVTRLARSADIVVWSTVRATAQHPNFSPRSLRPLAPRARSWPRSHRSASKGPGPTAPPPSSRCRPGPAASSGPRHRPWTSALRTSAAAPGNGSAGSSVPWPRSPRCSDHGKPASASCSTCPCSRCSPSR